MSSKTKNSGGEKPSSKRTKKPTKPDHQKQYHVIRRCNGLEGPAIFLDYDDFLFHLEDEEDNEYMEYKSFDSIEIALAYIVMTSKKHRSANGTPALVSSCGTIHTKSPPPSASAARGIRAATQKAPPSYSTTSAARYVPIMPATATPGGGGGGVYAFSPLASFVATAAEQPLLSTKKRGRKRKAGSDASYSYLNPEQREEAKKQAKLKKAENFPEQMELLKEFKTEFGHCYPPQVNPKTIKKENSGLLKYQGLNRFTKFMREEFKVYCQDQSKSILTDEQAKALEEINIFLTKDETVFDEMFNRLKGFRREHGHCQVQQRPTNALHGWMLRMRKAREDMGNGKATCLTPERIAQLDRLGFPWKTHKRMTFDERGEEWKKYKETNNGAEPSPTTGLGRWCRKMRLRYLDKVEGRPTLLTDPQVEKMRSYGFNWESPAPNRTGVKKASFDQKFAKLVEYKKIHGDVMVPQKNKELGQWVKRTRKSFKKFLKGERSGLTRTRIKNLKNLGFVFSIREGKPRRPGTSGGGPRSGGGTRARSATADKVNSNNKQDDEDEDAENEDEDDENSSDEDNDDEEEEEEEEEEDGGDDDGNGNGEDDDGNGEDDDETEEEDDDELSFSKQPWEKFKLTKCAMV